jgi:hypothetical protein
MAQAAQLEAELRHQKSKNEELESKLNSMQHGDDDARSEISASPDLEALRTDIEIAQKEADELRHHLAQTQEDARLAADMAEELLEKEKGYEEEIELLRKRLEGTEKSAEEEKERQREKNEMQAVLDKKGEMVKMLQEKCKGLEEDLSEAEGNVEELRAAGQVCTTLSFDWSAAEGTAVQVQLTRRPRSLYMNRSCPIRTPARTSSRTVSAHSKTNSPSLSPKSCASNPSLLPRPHPLQRAHPPPRLTMKRCKRSSNISHPKYPHSKNTSTSRVRSLKVKRKGGSLGSKRPSRANAKRANRCASCRAR